MPSPTRMVTTSFLRTLALFIIVGHPSPATSQPWISDTGHHRGRWRLLQASIGISAMHMQLLPNNMLVIFDRTDFGPSNISLAGSRCRLDPSDAALKVDCTAHSVLYDVTNNTFRPLTIQTDTWCSSGAVTPDGTLVQTGGYNDGDRVVRTLAPCATCDWVEFPGYLSVRRWYGTNQILPDGRIIIIGGRRQFNYEFYPRNSLFSSPRTFWLEFLRETGDEYENNLYPFVHLLPDGNLFIFANTRAISLDYKQNRVIREFPPITGGDSRNYPSSGSSVLLPLDENKPIDPEIMICGGAPKGSYPSATKGTFTRASSTCGRLRVADEYPLWAMENMPMARVMGDMILLPDGSIIIVNGAELGTAGWENGREPVTHPVIYQPEERRFSVMCSAARPRLYHSSALLLAEGTVLVGGSNPHVYYNFTAVEFPTDLSLEEFSPPYLAPENQAIRPRIVGFRAVVGYTEPFEVIFTVPTFLRLGIVSVAVVAPSFATHSVGMNQRMVVVRTTEVSQTGPEEYRVRAVGPSAPEIAPPGYYMLFVVHAGIPSSGAWMKIQ